jgi:hypothetical protein
MPPRRGSLLKLTKFYLLGLTCENLPQNCSGPRGGLASHPGACQTDHGKVIREGYILPGPL